MAESVINGAFGILFYKLSNIEKYIYIYQVCRNDRKKCHIVAETVINISESL